MILFPTIDLLFMVYVFIMYTANPWEVQNDGWSLLCCPSYIVYSLSFFPLIYDFYLLAGLFFFYNDF